MTGRVTGKRTDFVSLLWGGAGDMYLQSCSSIAHIGVEERLGPKKLIVRYAVLILLVMIGLLGAVLTV